MVSVLVSFTSVRRRSQPRSAPTYTPERTTLDSSERSCSDLKSGVVHALAGLSLVSSATLTTLQLLERRGAVEDTTHLVPLRRAVALAEVAFAGDHEPMPFEHWPGCQAGKGGDCR